MIQHCLVNIRLKIEVKNICLVNVDSIIIRCVMVLFLVHIQTCSAIRNTEQSIIMENIKSGRA